MSPYRSPDSPVQARRPPRAPWWRLAWAWCRGVFHRRDEPRLERRPRWARGRWDLPPDASGLLLENLQYWDRVARWDAADRATRQRYPAAPIRPPELDPGVTRPPGL